MQSIAAQMPLQVETHTAQLQGWLAVMNLSGVPLWELAFAKGVPPAWGKPPVTGQCGVKHTAPRCNL